MTSTLSVVTTGLAREILAAPYWLAPADQLTPAQNTLFFLLHFIPSHFFLYLLLISDPIETFYTSILFPVHNRLTFFIYSWLGGNPPSRSQKVWDTDLVPAVLTHFFSYIKVW